MIAAAFPTVLSTLLRQASSRRRVLGAIALLSTASVLLVAGAPAEAASSCVAGGPSTSTALGYTGSEQCYVVPAGVTSAQIVAVGGSSTYFGGNADGAKVTGTVAVTPGSTLYVEVGGAPDVSSVSNALGFAGGFNGGGAGGDGSGGSGGDNGGAGGGGASDVQTCSMEGSSCQLTAASGDPRLIVAGGAGGVGSQGQGGSAGGTNSGAGDGGAASVAGGTGGTGAGGGAHGGTFAIAGNAGTPGQGGAGGIGAGISGYGGGGGGGGGYTGGGGGSAGQSDGGGGGGGGSSDGPTGTTITTASAGEAPSVTITPAAAITLTSSQSPATIGHPVTFTATVFGDRPVGTVTFVDGSTLVCFPQTLSEGVVTCTTSALSLGSHSIRAIYSGDANNLQSTSPVLTQEIIAPMTSTPPTTTSSTTTSTTTTSPTTTSPTTTSPPTVPAASGARPTGSLGARALGRLRLGMTRARSLRAYASGISHDHHYEETVAVTGGDITASYASPRLLRSLSATERRVVRDRVVLLLTSNPYYAIRGLHPGARLGTAARRLHAGSALHIGSYSWYLAPDGAGTLVVAVRGGVVKKIGTTEAALTRTRQAQRILIASST